MACSENMKELLSAHLDGELFGDEEKLVNAHLEECPRCLEYLGRLSKALGVLKALPDSEPEEDPMPILRTELAFEAVREVKRRAMIRSAAFIVGAVAAVVIVALVFVYALPGIIDSTDVVERPDRPDNEQIQPPKPGPREHDPDGKYVIKPEDGPPDDPTLPDKREDKVVIDPDKPVPEDKPKPEFAELPVVPETRPGPRTQEIVDEPRTGPTLTPDQLREKALLAVGDFRKAHAGGTIADQFSALRKLAGIDIAETYFLLKEVLVNTHNLFRSCVRKEAVAALGELATTDAAELCFIAAEDTCFDVSDEAVFVLRKIKAPDAIKLHLNMFRKTKDSRQRRLAADMIGRLGSELDAEVLEKAVRKEKDIFVRAAAIVALGRLKKDIRYFSKLYNNPRGNGHRWFLRQAVVRALGLTGNPEALPILKKALSDPSGLVREEAARGIANINSIKGAGLLKKAARSVNQKSRLYGELRDAYIKLTEDDGFGRRANFHFMEDCFHTRSVLFVVDVSSTWLKGDRKDWVMNQLAESLSTLEKDQFFNILLFAESTRLITTKPRPATLKNIADVKRKLEHYILKPEMAGSDFRKALDVAVKQNADTVILITDGFTATKKKWDHTSFVRRFSDVNRLTRQVVVHTVGVFLASEGTPLDARPVGVPVDFLKCLARENNGTFSFKWFAR